MRLLSRLSRRSIQMCLFMMFGAALAGCLGSINIQKPADNLTITLPAKTKVVVTANTSFSDLKVAVDGTDVSGQIVWADSNRKEGVLSLTAGTHSITADAQMSCWYCIGGKRRSTDTHVFTVSSPITQVCDRAGGAPVITFDAGLIAVAQEPGRRKIGYFPKNGKDVLLILVDDAPDLQQNQMRVEIDLDPFNNVTWAKAVEAWGFCRSGSRVNLIEVSLPGGFGIGTTCSPRELTPANDFRSGCTQTQSMLLDQTTTNELWLRKPGTFGIWEDVEALDSSIWQAFGGRSVRFVWRYN